MTDKDYHEGYFEGVRAALLAYMHFQEDDNKFHAWLNKEVTEAKDLRDNT
jgi:hypothetical protein